MSDTPETDSELHGIKAICKDEYMLDTMAEFARKLERERDEAREAMREAWFAMDETDGTERMIEWQNKNANILEGAK